MINIKEIPQGHPDRLICPYCKTRLSALGVSKDTVIHNATLKCPKCKRTLSITKTQ